MLFISVLHTFAKASLHWPWALGKWHLRTKPGMYPLPLHCMPMLTIIMQVADDQHPTTRLGAHCLHPRNAPLPTHHCAACGQLAPNNTIWCALLVSALLALLMHPMTYFSVCCLCCLLTPLHLRTCHCTHRGRLAPNNRTWCTTFALFAPALHTSADTSLHRLCIHAASSH